MRAYVVFALLGAALNAAVGACHRSETARPAGESVASGPVPSPSPPGPPDPSVLEIRDGSDFTVTIPSRARPCIVFPPNLFDASTCPPGAKPAPEHPGGMPDKARLLAIAALESDSPGGSRIQLTISLNRMDHPHQPVPATADAFARGAVDRAVENVQRSQPGVTVRGGVPAVQILTPHGVPMAKISYDLEGTAGTAARLAHASIYVVWVPAGVYVVTLNAPLENAAYAGALADEMAGTLRVAQLAPPMPPGVF